jgi:hypothetical protein
MNNTTDMNQIISAGDTASIENTHSKELSISIVCSNDCRLDMTLAPGQIVGFSAGNSDAHVILHHGNPANLLIIKPDSAS